VDYATGWPLAKAVPEATEDVIAGFLFHEIYMHYGALQEIFSDGGKSLWGGVVERYLSKIMTAHKGASPFYPHTNGKRTQLCDLHLDQAPFACRVRTQSTTNTSPSYLVWTTYPISGRRQLST
jgi:hypothetical protein